MHSSVVVVGTFPPTQCGLATFTRSTATAIAEGRKVGVVELVDAPRGLLASLVCDTWVRNDPASLRHVISTIASYDAVIVQHEFGIYGGQDGDEVLQLVRGLHQPLVVVLHTILESPSQHQREILEELAARADIVVTLTATARNRLLRTVTANASKVVVVPHGAHEVAYRADSVNGDPRVVLTWGLLGPGKGIEHAIAAMARLEDLDPAPEYWIVGETHPKVFESNGEEYRNRLVGDAERLGIAHRVKFFDGYRDLRSLHGLVAQADLVVLPYDSREQVTSGVLVEAIAAGLPVVATGFPHARELLADGCGLVVPHEDPVALSQAIRMVLTDSTLRLRLRDRARAIAPSLYWPAIGRTFGSLVERCVAESGRIDAKRSVSA